MTPSGVAIYKLGAAAAPVVTGDEPPDYFRREFKQDKQMNFMALQTYIRDLEQSGFDTVHLRVPQVLLDHQVVVDGDGTVRLGFDGRTDAFDEGFLDDFVEQYGRAIDRLAADGADWTAPTGRTCTIRPICAADICARPRARVRSVDCGCAPS